MDTTVVGKTMSTTGDEDGICALQKETAAESDTANEGVWYANNNNGQRIEYGALALELSVVDGTGVEPDVGGTEDVGLVAGVGGGAVVVVGIGILLLFSNIQLQRFFPSLESDTLPPGMLPTAPAIPENYYDKSRKQRQELSTRSLATTRYNICANLTTAKPMSVASLGNAVDDAIRILEVEGTFEPCTFRTTLERSLFGCRPDIMVVRDETGMGYLAFEVKATAPLVVGGRVGKQLWWHIIEFLAKLMTTQWLWMLSGTIFSP
eukprot:scaffold3579_cov168-Cylindrotheca_fusiformis.AAC.6